MKHFKSIVRKLVDISLVVLGLCLAGFAIGDFFKPETKADTNKRG